MDTEMLYRTKLQEIEREVRLMRLLVSAREATPRGLLASGPAARRCPSIPLRLLRRACRQAGALRPAS
ncbi:MAG: hypothetical protein Q7R32_08020 [Dehalococcoidia bacterium]|nr:hypothetical protein [Dehalococcoidia bacterium]